MARKITGVRITSAMLRRAGACTGFCRKFRKKYPNGVIANSETCTKAGSSRMFGEFWTWAAKRLLNEAGQAIFNSYNPGPKTSYNPGPKTSYKADRRVRAALFGALIECADYRAF